MKPWREIAVPHPDVLEGTFQQSEFAADITAVRTGTATREYQDASAFDFILARFGRVGKCYFGGYLCMVRTAAAPCNFPVRRFARALFACSRG